MKHCSRFGQFIREERERKNIRLWKFAASVPFPQSNIQRIETGRVEPRVGLAVRMVHALGLNAGEFMKALIETQGWGASPNPAGVAHPSQTDNKLLIAENSLAILGSPAEIFGWLIKAARLSQDLTQTKVAEYAGYTTRSLIAVEGGRQEPALTTALRFVWVTGVPVRSFFRQFESILYP